jgi:hypothetical protein
MSDLTYRETVTEYTTDTAPAEGDHWLRHDEIFQDTMGELIVLLRDEWRAAIREQVESLQEKIRSLELKLCEAAGAISVLRTGRVLNPRGTFDDAATYEMMDVVALNGGASLRSRTVPDRARAKVGNSYARRAHAASAAFRDGKVNAERKASAVSRECRNP